LILSKLTKQRPGPYINAEASGGGFPGWIQRTPGKLRTPNSHFMKATDLYVSEISKIIAKAQITNGGPVIILQPENEYSPWADKDTRFPDPDYMNAVYAQFRKAGIVVPLVSNDASNNGLNAPGDEAPVDIYGHDGYPLKFDCSNPDFWDPGSLPTDWRKVHLDQSPNTPYAVPEFQGGSFDAWGGTGMEKCLTLTGADFERVFFKNMISFGINIFNVYMTFGGTNWGNLGHPHGYTSYDYAAVISEERLVDREKYSEAKLIATFIESSPEYLSAEPDPAPTKGVYTNTTDIVVTRLVGDNTIFYVIRHDKFWTRKETHYGLKIFDGRVTIPLVLRGRDSKILVTNYRTGNSILAFADTEIFTWKYYESSGRTILVLYGDDEAYSQLAFHGSLETIGSPAGMVATQKDDLTFVNWNQSSKEDRYIQVGGIFILSLTRHQVYDMWVLSMPSGDSLYTPYTRTANSSAIIKGGYLMRTAVVLGDKMFLTGDLNETTTIQIIGGAPENLTELHFNGESIPFAVDKRNGIVSGHAIFKAPNFTLPDLGTAKWKVVDSLPEITSNYSDSKWTPASLKKTYNDKQPQLTPTSLFASDYGYNWGYTLFRGTFKAKGSEKKFSISTRGGLAFAASFWLDDTYLGYYTGHPETETKETDFAHLKLPKLSAGKSYNLIVLIDNMGHNQNWNVGVDETKLPIGILDYKLSSRDKNAIKWKITGNIHGEDYLDRVRGPANEGGLWAERQGYHLPNPPTDDWEDSKGPIDGISKAGVAFYSTTFNLSIPLGYDIPISIQIGKNTEPLVDASDRPAYRLQIYVNGWQFGKYVNNVGPQVSFPVPEGIWNYRGQNWLGISLWNLEDKEVKVEDVKLVSGMEIQSGMTQVGLVESPPWSHRHGAY
jgi:hypothetical protein